MFRYAEKMTNSKKSLTFALPTKKKIKKFIFFVLFALPILLNWPFNEFQLTNKKKKQKVSARAGTWTLDRWIKSPTLYQLSYPGNLVIGTNFTKNPFNNWLMDLSLSGTQHSSPFIRSEWLENFCASTGPKATFENPSCGALKCQMYSTSHSLIITLCGLSCCPTFHSSLKCTCTCLVNERRSSVEEANKQHSGRNSRNFIFLVVGLDIINLRFGVTWEYSAGKLK